MSATTTQKLASTETRQSPGIEGSGPVVLIRCDGANHGPAMRWASAFAAALSTDLVLIRLVSGRPLATNLLFPHRHAAEGLRQAKAALRVMQARARWQRRFFSGGTAPAFLSIPREGTARLIDSLAGLAPRLVVLPASGVWPGDAVGRLATGAQVPVLVARAPRAPDGEAPIVAASNLADARLPVLTHAADVAHALGRPLTFVHNLDPVPFAWVGTELYPMTAGIEQAALTFSLQTLERVAQTHDADVTVTRQGDPVTGILSAARRAVADLVVVGAASSPSFISRRVTARVITAARRSVLVVPLPSSDSASSAEAPRDSRSSS